MSDFRYERRPEHEHSYRAEDTRYYDVYLGDELIGHVFSCRQESWRKSGRIRTSMIGNPKHWEAYRPHPTLDYAAHHQSSYRVGYHHYTRGEAADALKRQLAETR